MMAPIGASTSTTGNDRFRRSVLPATVAYPAMNSSASPGRKNPSSRPVSANRISGSAASLNTLSRCCGEMDPRREASTCTTHEASRAAYSRCRSQREGVAKMPIASPDVYAEMLDRAKAGGFAYPAINCTSSQTINAALRGFAEAESDGIIQISWGGAEFASSQYVKDMVIGAVALAEFAHVVAEKFPVNVALHTDHCPPDKLDGYMRPLIAISQDRVAQGLPPLFQSHMWDGSAVELEENLRIARELLASCAKAHIIMELEIGVVGGEEDGVANEINEKLYTHPADAMRTAEVLGLGENGRYLLAATFGNVHGSYKPGAVKLRPSILKEIQD